MVTIAGAGLTGATIARVLAEKGEQVTVYEKRDFVGGLCADTRRGGRFGPHIFHTDDEEVWEFVNRFCEMKPYTHRVMALTDRGMVPWPPNDDTRERCDVFHHCIKGYSEKMWGEIPSEDVLDRIPRRYGRDRAFFASRHVALPGSYTSLIRNMLDHPAVTVHRSVEVQPEYVGIYTGRLPGVPYRYVRFDEVPDPHLITPVVNICTPSLPWTRITDYAQLGYEGFVQAEYPNASEGVACYPVRQGVDAASRAHDNDTLFAGRLGAYEYLDMDKAVRAALDLARGL